MTTPKQRLAEARRLLDKALWELDFIVEHYHIGSCYLRDNIRAWLAVDDEERDDA